MGRQVGIVAVTFLAMALAACQTIGNSAPVTNSAAGSQANIQSLTAVINANPQDPNGYNVRGIAYAESGQTRDALSDFAQAITLNPQFYQAYANRGLLYRNLGRYDDALADYSRAIQINPNYAYAYSGRGATYRMMGQTSPALADFNQAIALNPADAYSYYNRGLIFRDQGQDELAIADFTSSISFNYIDAYYARGQVYLARQNYRQAFDDFFQAIQNGNASAEAWTYLAQALEGEGDLATAYIAYSNALTIDPRYSPAQAGQARTAAYAAAPTPV